MHEDDTLTQDAAAVAQAQRLSARVENRPAPISGYTLKQGLGEGSYGTVWLAREDNTGKQVAIKFYTHHRGLDWSLLNREVEKLAVLYTSRNIVRLVGVGWDANPPYYVMEYLENGSLASMLMDGPLPPHEAVRIAKSVAQALVHAHGSGILHCDLKPANVLLDGDFEPRLCDFGQSRLSNEQSPALGTLFYMAPEQADLNAIPDARWDVYALGALLFHMICGHAPYWTEANESRIRTAETLDQRLAIYRQILKSSERPAEMRSLPGVDRRLAEIIDRCLRIDPQRRFANAQAVLDALEERDRQRARRPLMILGIVGPGLLLLTMAFIVGNVLKKAVNDARETLVGRALESDLHSARILARSLKRDLDDRQAELEQLADSSILRESVLKADNLPWAERVLLFKSLKNAIIEGDETRTSFGRPLDTSWFVTDATGKQIWRFQESKYSDLKNYSFRDYFHGRRRQYTAATVPKDIKPIEEPHISLPYRSASTQSLTVAVSVPIWDEAHSSVIGVLGRSTQLGHLLDDYGEGIRGGTDVNRVVALVELIEAGDQLDVRLLSHPWMTGSQMQKLTNADYQNLILNEQDAEKVAKELIKDIGVAAGSPADVVIATYDDPVGKAELSAETQVSPPSEYSGEWLAAFVPIQGTGWAAVVQERRDDALAPIVHFQREISRYAFGGLVAGCALVGLLWYFVFRALSDRSAGLWVRRTGTSRPSEKGSTVSGK